jgi:hypothetical protein
VTGQAPNRELVIEWRNVRHYSCLTSKKDQKAAATFQVVFFENRRDILFNYADVVFATTCSEAISQGASATVGIQMDYFMATQYSYNGKDGNGAPRLLSNRTAILWKLE